MKKHLLIAFMSFALFEARGQCYQPACENLPTNIELLITPTGDDYSFNWTLPTAFVGQGDSIITLTVGAAPDTIAYTVTVTNLTTGCVADYICSIVVGLSAQYVSTIPPACANDVPFDLTPYLSPPGALISGAAVTGTIYDPSIGGPIDLSPPPGSGCIVGSTVPITINPLPTIISSTVTQ
jgi:hypothetical protein